MMQWLGLLVVTVAVFAGVEANSETCQDKLLDYMNTCTGGDMKTPDDMVRWEHAIGDAAFLDSMCGATCAGKLTDLMEACPSTDDPINIMARSQAACSTCFREFVKMCPLNMNVTDAASTVKIRQHLCSTECQKGINELYDCNAGIFYELRTNSYLAYDVGPVLPCSLLTDKCGLALVQLEAANTDSGHMCFDDKKEGPIESIMCTTECAPSLCNVAADCAGYTQADLDRLEGRKADESFTSTADEFTAQIAQLQAKCLTADCKAVIMPIAPTMEPSMPTISLTTATTTTSTAEPTQILLSGCTWISIGPFVAASMVASGLLRVD